MADRESQLSRRSPFHDLGIVETWPPLQRMSQLLEEFRGDVPGALATPLDVTETDDRYVATIEVPGVSKDDLTVECKEGVLSVRGEKKSEREETKEKARVLERRYGAFSRTLALPSDADSEQVKAAFKDGVLRVEIPKRPEAKPKTIAIKG